ncbi:MAG: Fic family protein [Micrococcaceae bacterium]
MSEANEKWKPLEKERYPWESQYGLSMLSRKQRTKIEDTYEATVPQKISKLNVDTPHDLQAQMSELLVLLSRFDATQATKPYTFPAMLLRSESAASSEIEHLTSSIKNIALAQLTPHTSQNAQIIAGNVDAMHTAMSLPGDLSVETISEVHKALMRRSGVDFAGKIRTQQVWIGGNSVSPHSAFFVPPHHKRVQGCLKDLVAYASRLDIIPIVKAAIVHAQFETIHPFIDGNGRTGRTLLHKILKQDEVLQTVTLPISAGLLHNISGYMDSLHEYQSGNPIAIIQQVTDALELAINIGGIVSEKIDEIYNTWLTEITDTKASGIWNLLPLLVEQPVVDSKYISEKLGITLRGANKLLEKAQDYDILQKFGHEKRGIYYQAKDLVTIFNHAADVKKNAQAS